VDTLFKLACILGRAHSTVKRWVKCYREQGLHGLLEIHPGGGRTLSLPQEVLGQLDKRLQEPKGFDHYTDIQTWLKAHYGVDIPCRLKASPKVVRPQSHTRDESEAIDFQKRKPLRLSIMMALYRAEGRIIR
jgi:transposase